MTSGPSPLAELAQALGISTRFHDTLGNEFVASDATVHALIAATGIRIGSDADIADALHVLSSDPFAEIPIADSGTVRLNVADRFEWQLVLEDGTTREGRSDGELYLSEVPVGLHELSIRTAEGLSSTPLPSPPASAPSVSAIAGKSHIWGVAAPVYGLDGPCGLGTYRQLGELAAGLGQCGADYLLCSPVHALFPSAPEAYSPYSPSHRRFFNIAHIDPTLVPEFSACPEAKAILSESVANARDAALIDYKAFAETHGPVLEALFHGFDSLAPEHPRKTAFGAWRRERGQSLHLYALYQALAETHGPFWHDWPASLRDASKLAPMPEVERKLHKHMWFQWLAESQLFEANEQAKREDMALGLMLDLAVGVRSDGAEAWAEPELLARGVSIGAPPDAFNPAGQNWALAPLNPRSMRAGGLRAFADTLRASMRHAGALRIDHVLGFRRNFWIADETGEGAYIQFPQKALFATLAIEADRNACIVVGEDLGNVPPGFREEMEHAGIYGCRLVYFQKTDTGALLDPRAYEPKTVASIGSHDLATLDEWWHETDLNEMSALGVLADAPLQEARSRREHDRRFLCALLDIDDEPDLDTLLIAVHKRLAESGSELVTLQLEILLKEGARLNLPGTTTEYPNWRRRLPPNSEMLSDARLQGLVATTDASRRSR